VINGGDAKPLHDQAGLYDLDDLANRLREHAEEWVSHHFPRGRRNGNEWRLANIKGDPPRKNGSCVITLKGDHAGDWIDFDGGDGGGPIDTLAQATGRTGRDLYAYAARLVGVASDSETSRLKKPAKAQMPRKGASREIDAILGATMPITGTLGSVTSRLAVSSISHARSLVSQESGTSGEPGELSGHGRDRPKPGW
jgi:hypothetical protein